MDAGLRLKWKRTFPDVENDFLGKDPGRKRMFARIYWTNSHATERPWYWTVSAEDRRIASGYESAARPAARAAEAAYAAWETAGKTA